MAENLKLKILSYNIHKGFTSGTQRFVLEQIRQAIRMVRADIVFLQEVVGKNENHAKKLAHKWPGPQFEYMADQLWPHMAYGKNAIYTQGHHGNAILSKFPFSEWENIDISTNRIESRGLLHGILRIPNTASPLHVMCLHLGLFEVDRTRQIETLCKRIESLVPHDEPLIVAGDFNDWREQATRVLKAKCSLKEAFLEHKGAHAKTFPVWFPVLRLDRIYYRGLTIRSARCHTRFPWNNLSDHAAVSARFHLRKVT